MPSAERLEIMVEDQSTEVFLRALLPKLLPAHCTFGVHPFQGKSDLLAQLEGRLRGYAQWLPPNWRIVILVDRDDDDCVVLKRRLEDIAKRVGMQTRSRAGNKQWQVVNRISIEELEAWYFGDWAAVQAVYPRAPDNIPNKAAFRDPDAIRGGTWEAFERIMNVRGYFRGGLRKQEAAWNIGACVDPVRSQSRSFQLFCEAIREAAL